jgi:hypothetical protein
MRLESSEKSAALFYSFAWGRKGKAVPFKSDDSAIPDEKSFEILEEFQP